MADQHKGVYVWLTSLCVCPPAVQCVLRESQVICDSKDRQIAELKKMSEQSADSLKNESEKKVRRKVKQLSFSFPVPLISRKMFDAQASRPRCKLSEAKLFIL